MATIIQKIWRGYCTRKMLNSYHKTQILLEKPQLCLKKKIFRKKIEKIEEKNT